MGIKSPYISFVCFLHKYKTFVEFLRKTTKQMFEPLGVNQIPSYFFCLFFSGLAKLVFASGIQIQTTKVRTNLVLRFLLIKVNYHTNTNTNTSERLPSGRGRQSQVVVKPSKSSSSSSSWASPPWLIWWAKHHTCKKRVIPVIYHCRFFWIFRKILGWEREINTAPKPSPEVAPPKMEVAPF